MTGTELAQRHVARFNDAVRSGDWEPMLRAFADDATMVFPQFSVHGLEAIRAAYREQPPDDEIRPLGIQENGDHEVVVAFAWTRGGTGRLELEHDRGLITKLTVVFDER